jgi:phosphatidylglycerophosphate synthase
VTQAAPLPAAEQRPTRPAELEDWLNARLYHPLSWRLARRLTGTWVTPDMVSVAGAVAVMLAALAYAQPGWPWSALAGLALHMGWHVIDGADGDLARLTGRASAHGELVDGVCDYAGHILLYLTLGWLAAAQIGAAGWVLMAAAGVSRVVQAAHYEGVRRQYQLVAYGTPWLASEAAAGGDREAGRRHPFVAYYLWLTGLIVPHRAALVVAAAEPTRCHVMRMWLYGPGKIMLRQMTPLSANYRTLAVGAAMLAGAPEWYFAFEIVVLGGVLMASLRRARAVFAGALAQAVSAST